METIGGRVSRVPAVVIASIGVWTVISGVEWYLGRISTPPSGEAQFGGVTITIFVVVSTVGLVLFLVGIRSHRDDLVAIPSAASVASLVFIVAVRYEFHLMQNTQLGILRLLVVTAVPAVVVWAGVRRVESPPGS